MDRPGLKIVERSPWDGRTVSMTPSTDLREFFNRLAGSGSTSVVLDSLLNPMHEFVSERRGLAARACYVDEVPKLVAFFEDLERRPGYEAAVATGAVRRPVDLRYARLRCTSADPE